jgi:hypothetical protein
MQEDPRRTSIDAANRRLAWILATIALGFFLAGIFLVKF